MERDDGDMHNRPDYRLWILNPGSNEEGRHNNSRAGNAPNLGVALTHPVAADRTRGHIDMALDLLGAPGEILIKFISVVIQNACNTNTPGLRPATPSRDFITADLVA